MQNFPPRNITPQNYSKDFLDNFRPVLPEIEKAVVGLIIAVEKMDESSSKLAKVSTEATVETTILTAEIKKYTIAMLIISGVNLIITGISLYLTVYNQIIALTP